MAKPKPGVWVNVRDGRPCADETPPAVCYFYSPDRKGNHPRAHLKAFRGILHADGYAGFKELYETKTLGEASAIQEAACMAHVRRKFFDLTTSPAPVAKRRCGGSASSTTSRRPFADPRPSGASRRARRRAGRASMPCENGWTRP